MVDRSLRRLQPLSRSLALSLGAVLALGCGTSGTAIDAAVRAGIDPASLVDVETAVLAPIVGGDGTVSIVAIRQEDGQWQTSPITSSRGPRDQDSLHLLSYDGATGEPWNALVFGTAAPGTVRVELVGFTNQRGGTVVDGAWLIALQEKGIGPGDLAWRFVADDGTVRTGHGIFPPDA